MSEHTLLETSVGENEKLLSRRKALARLGLAAGVTAYVTPLLTGLNDAAAQAGGCPPGYHRSHGTCVHN